MSGSQNMGSQYLEIFQAKRSDYYAAIASVSPSCHLFFFSFGRIVYFSTDILYGIDSNIITCSMGTGQLRDKLGEGKQMAPK